MAALHDQLNADLRHAMRAGDAVRRDEIRGLIANLNTEKQAKLTRALHAKGLIPDDPDAKLTPEQLEQIDQIRASNGLTDDEEQAVLLTRIVQHRQSIDAFKKGKRADLLTAEEAQLAVLSTYQPQLSDAELEQIIQEAVRESGAQSLRDQGKVMPLLSARLRGKADMKAVAARVQSLLGGR